MRKARHRSSLNRKLLTLLWFAAAALIVWIHLNRPGLAASTVECNAAELHAATLSGEAAAAAVIDFPAGSMQREDAILAIRARESELRTAGFPTAADSFAAAAERRLKADKVI
ncbi:MAG: hypothetical protein NC418_07225 [Muribaculaceae bacterium]|nr:hypothetical protein [Muribaculaceae bacterium]